MSRSIKTYTIRIFLILLLAVFISLIAGSEYAWSQAQETLRPYEARDSGVGDDIESALIAARFSEIHETPIRTIEAIESALKDILGEDDLVAALRWPDDAEAREVAKGALHTLAALALREKVDFRDPTEIQAFLSRKIPYGIYIGTGEGSRTIEEGLIRKQIFPMAGGFAPITCFRDAIKSWRFDSNRPAVAAIDYITAYHLLAEEARIAPVLKRKIVTSVKKDWQNLSREAQLTPAEVRNINPDDVISVIEENLLVAFQVNQENDIADVMRRLHTFIYERIEDNQRAFRLYTDIAILLVKPIVEANDWGEDNPYIDSQKAVDILGENVLIAVGSPYGTLAAYRAGYQRLQAQWDKGRLSRSDYAGACFSDTSATYHSTRYPDFNLFIWLSMFNLHNPAADPENVIGAASKQPLDAVKGKGHFIFPDTHTPEYSAYSGAVPVVLEWAEMSDEQQLESQEDFEDGKGVTLNAGFTFIFNTSWFTDEVFERIRQEHYKRAKGKEETWFTKALDIRSKQHTQELKKGAHTSSRVTIVSLPQPTASGVKNKVRIKRYMTERDRMMNQLLGTLEGVELAPGAHVVVRERDGFKIERDLAAVFRGSRQRPIKIAGEVFLEIDKDTVIEGGANLDGRKWPLSLSCAGQRIPGDYNSLDSLDERHNFELTPNPSATDLRIAEVVLTERDKENLGQRGIIISPWTKVTIFGKGLNRDNLYQALEGIFGSFINDRKVVEQIYLSGEEVRLNTTTNVENGASLWNVALRGNSIAGRMVKLSHVDAVDAVFCGHPQLDGWSYTLPYQRENNIVGVQAERTIFLYGVEALSITFSDCVVTRTGTQEEIGRDQMTGITTRGERREPHFEALAKLLTESGLLEFEDSSDVHEVERKLDLFFDPVPEDVASSVAIDRIFMPGYISGGYTQGQFLGLPDWDNTNQWRIEKVSVNTLIEFARATAYRPERLGPGVSETEVRDFCDEFVDKYNEEAEEAVEHLLHARLSNEAYWQAGKTANQLNNAVRLIIRAILVKHGELRPDEGYNPYEATNRTANQIALAAIEGELSLKEYEELSTAAGFVDFDNPVLRQRLQDEGIGFIREQFARNKRKHFAIDFWTLYEESVVESEEPILVILELDNNGEMVMDLKSKLEQLRANPNMVVVFVGKDGQYSNDASWLDVERVLVDDMLDFLSDTISSPRLGGLWTMMVREQLEGILDAARGRNQIDDGQKTRILDYCREHTPSDTQARFFNFTSGPKLQGLDGDRISRAHARLLLKGTIELTTRAGLLEFITGREPLQVRAGESHTADLSLLVEATENKILVTKGQGLMEMTNGMSELDSFKLGMIKGESTRTISGLADTASPMVMLFVPAGRQHFRGYAEKAVRDSSSLKGLVDDSLLVDAEGEYFNIAKETVLEVAHKLDPNSIVGIESTRFAESLAEVNQAFDEAGLTALETSNALVIDCSTSGFADALALLGTNLPPEAEVAFVAINADQAEQLEATGRVVVNAADYQNFQAAATAARRRAEANMASSGRPRPTIWRLLTAGEEGIIPGFDEVISLLGQDHEAIVRLLTELLGTIGIQEKDPAALQRALGILAEFV